MADRSRAATVLVPTHDHGPLLQRALVSAQRQSVEDIEILVVGDGVPDVTREIVMHAQAADPRVRWFDNVKGERHGESHRHEALAGASGRIVCYLSDDDLWCPDHVEVMSRLLENADWANTLPVAVVGEDLEVLPVDVSIPAERDRLVGGENSVPLSCSAHTLAAYRRLPRGWHPGPTTVPSDLHMHQQFLVSEWCRARSGFTFTALVFPSPMRRAWTEERRVAELDAWLPLLTEPARQLELNGFGGPLVDTLARQLADLAVTHRRATKDWESWIAHFNREKERLQATLDTLRVHSERVRGVLEERERELVAERFRREQLEAPVSDLGGTRDES